MTKAKAGPAQKRKPAPGKDKATKAKDGWTKIPGDTPVDEVIRKVTGKRKTKTVAKTAPAPVVFDAQPAETTAKQQRGRPFEKGQSGNPAGRPKGARHKLAQDFIRVLAEDFVANGKEVIEKLRQDNPAAYAKTISGVLPKIIELEDEEDDSGGKPVSGVLLITKDFIRGLIQEDEAEG